MNEIPVEKKREFGLMSLSWAELLGSQFLVGDSSVHLSCWGPDLTWYCV